MFDLLRFLVIVRYVGLFVGGNLINKQNLLLPLLGKLWEGVDELLVSPSPLKPLEQLRVVGG